MVMLVKIYNILSQVHAIVFGRDFDRDLAPPSLTM